MSTNTAYDKANSILGIRGAKGDKVAVLKRIKALCEKKPPMGRDDELATIHADLFEQTEQPDFFLRDHVVEEITRLQDDELERYLRYRYRYDVYPIKKIIQNYPPLVQIEPASICNFRCVFCYQVDPLLSNKKHGHMGVMDLDLFKQIIDQLEGHVEAVTLASRGEPTVNKRLAEMLQYMSGKFLAVKVNTNASLLTEELCHAILSADLQTLVFSADAASKELYSKLRVQGDFDQVLKNIKRFNQIRSASYPSSTLITRVSGVRYTQEQDIDEMERFWGDQADQVVFVDYNPWENIYDAEKNELTTPCSDLWRRMFVWWDGKVAPCDVDYRSLLSPGNIPDQSISEIWQNADYAKLRELHLNKARQELEPCSRCTVV